MEFKTTQEKWTDALIQTWKEYGRLTKAVLRAFDVEEGVVVSDEEWKAMGQELLKFTPKLVTYKSGFIVMKAEVTAFVADRAHLASTALWDGKFELAKKLMSKGGRPPRSTASKASNRRANYLSACGTRIVPLCGGGLNKGADWKTVK